MLTLIMGIACMIIACMIIGYVLGSIDTDKKWVTKTKEVKAGDPSCKGLFLRVKYADGSEEVIRAPEKDTFLSVGYRDGTIERVRVPADGSEVFLEKKEFPISDKEIKKGKK